MFSYAITVYHFIIYANKAMEEVADDVKINGETVNATSF